MDDEQNQLAALSAETVARVFREVWDELSRRQYEDACRSISALARPVPPAARPLADRRRHVSNNLVASYDTLEPEICEIELTVDPHPPYDSCAPLGSNTYVGDDSSEMPFFPYEDDPTFDRQTYLAMYSQLAWQTSMRNPHEELIVLETAARLQERYKCSLESIDATDVLPVHLVGDAGVSVGLVHSVLQRDYPAWVKPTPARLQNLSNSRFSDSNDLVGRAKSMTNYFCPNLDCIHPFCMTHVNITQVQSAGPSRRSLKDLAKLVKKPCLTLCFKDQIDQPSGEMSWTEADMQELKSLVDIDPQVIPCDLAIIMRKACRDVYAMWPSCQPLPPGGNSGKQSGLSNTVLPTIRHMFVDSEDSLQYTPNDPCTHQGSCDENCPCFQNSMHCERNCHCSKQCIRRWKGCKCAHKSKRCRTDLCPCRRALRECDIELCKTCKACDVVAADATTKVPTTRCQNVDIQRGNLKSTEVCSGQFGMGLFSLEPIAEDEFIIEYVGEMIFDATTTSRDWVTRHRRRNYVYALNKATDLDAAFGGNVSRYVNHSAGAEVNCEAMIRLVNGCHRLGLFACNARYRSGRRVIPQLRRRIFRVDVI
ncbi:SET domain-containing protein [Auriscalpium vulgare]|uniref:SET domain-containing protein n=1 Tax=Auriscalpium vulgare TaxID=40419 RepID=A0ACB8S6E0_9AGAM|nr:SET domain-containing protein [Auriscalpium vulgare]